MSVTIYHNPRCSKSRATLTLLEERGLDVKVVEYLKTPPTAKELKRIVTLLGKKPRDILRPKEAREAGIDDADLSDDALIERMVANPAVIERPIVVTDSGARVGRPPAAVLELFS